MILKLSGKAKNKQTKNHPRQSSKRTKMENYSTGEQDSFGYSKRGRVLFFRQSTQMNSHLDT
jgi:uncharacterized protein Smg (DUF494 family)